MVSKTISGVWTLFTDVASNVKGPALGIVLIAPSEETLTQATRTVALTNNEDEYEALVAGLELARGLGSEVIEIKCNSQLVVNQIHGIFDTKEERMQQYLKADALANLQLVVLLFRFKEWSVIHIPREENMEADALANLGSSRVMKGVDSCAVV
ncbi:uncharacterized protein LOC142169734 [Nicotiana tabacum]|uniref:Uncharacterized protein LOC142169734 n=1 Tax=Nicotiana tabacum TaxID=4097 RepID=A0AC58SRY9_TOBAC